MYVRLTSLMRMNKECEWTIGAICSWLICKVYLLLISLVVIVHCGYRKAIPTGMMAGAMAQFLASPTDLVKVRLQMEGKRVLQGLEPR